MHSLDGVDVRLMTSEGLSGLATTNIPELGSSVASTGDEDILVWSKRQATDCERLRDKRPKKRRKMISSYGPHHVSSVITELDNTNTGLDIPQHTCHVTRTCDDLSVVDESAAREIT